MIVVSSKHCILSLIILALMLVTVAPVQAQSSKRTTQRKPAQGARKPTAQQIAAFNDLAKRAAAARDAGRLDEAIDLYAQALQINPSWIEGWWYASTILYDRDHNAEARNAFPSFQSI